MNRYCIIIPTYNNCRTVADVVRRALAVCNDVVVVNDGSTDATADVLKETGVTVLTHNINRGKGKALKTGIEYARDKGFTHVVTIDADGQHFPERIHSQTVSQISGSGYRLPGNWMTPNQVSVSILLTHCMVCGS